MTFFIDELICMYVWQMRMLDELTDIILAAPITFETTQMCIRAIKEEVSTEHAFNSLIDEI